MKFIIYSPTYKNTSGGIIILHRLNTVLNCLGYISSICEFNNSIKVTNEIVIYPEIVKGNPLNATNVVRWELNKPGVVSNFTPEYGKNDLIVSFIPPFNPVVPTLTVFDMPNLLVNTNKVFDIVVLARRKLNLYHKEHPTITKITPQNRHWVAKCNTFISYDEHSFLSLEAAMYGATSIVIGNDYSTWKLNPFFKYGIGYNDDTWSLLTKDRVYDYLTKDMKEYCNISVINFIKLCQQKFQSV